MSAPSSQAFRTQSSSKIISIPTRHDPKSNQRVVLLKDIQLSFEHVVKRIMCGDEVALFLADEDFEYLIPPRIAHQPGVVLEVVTADDNQGDSTSTEVYRNNSHAVAELSVVTSSSNESMSMARNVPSLRIGGTDGNNQAIIVTSQELSSRDILQQIPTSVSNPLQLGTGNDMAQPDIPHPFQLRMEELVGKLQQTDQQRERTRQQMQDQIDQILQTLQRMDREHTKEADRITQQANLHRQVQQQIETVQQKLQQLEQDSYQQAQRSQQQHDLVLQQMRGMEDTRQAQDCLSPEVRGQEVQMSFGQFAHAQHLAQAVLAKSSAKLPIPRFFVILPEPTSIVDRQGGSPSMLFRLYFLCECGSHTMNKDCNKPHEIHLADHPGYDLNNQDQFINKYSSYLLSMMYMVKYGAKAEGLVVPPLLGLDNAIESIGRLVDDTITHLKEATGPTGGVTTAHQSLDATELTALKSHLKNKDSEGLTGGLNQMNVQHAYYYPWICSHHLRECFKPTLQQMRYSITTDSVWRGDKARIKVTSEAMTRQLYEDLGKLKTCWPIPQSASSPTTEIFSGLDDLESLSLDLSRFIMSVRDISRGKFKDVAISIGDLSALTLAAWSSSGNVRHLSVTRLRIDCDMKRFMAVFDLVRSTREKMLQGEEWPALRIFDLVHPEIKLKVFFEEGSSDLDMKSSINLKGHQPTSSLYNFIRHYGWTVTTLVAPGSFNDRLAILLDESTQKRHSRIAHIDVNPTSLTTTGLDATSQVIHRSRRLTYLRLFLEDLNTESQMLNAVRMLVRHGNRLSSLCLEGDISERWLPAIERSFPGKDEFPVLEEFFVVSPNMGYLSELDERWIASMVSASWQRFPLKTFGVTVDLKPSGWEILFKAIHFSTLEELHINSDYFYHEQLKLLVDCITDTSVSSLPMRVLDIKGCEVSDSDTTHEMLVRVQEKAPQVRIQCND
ncbi:hypothetical protein BGX34_000122 [Mortierella sp. NVP85]|nr:hypothetical protein BGX34_000122 [Mortierella sp. NVP85]